MRVLMPYRPMILFPRPYEREWILYLTCSDLGRRVNSVFPPFLFAKNLIVCLPWKYFRNPKPSVTGSETTRVLRWSSLSSKEV